MRAERLISQPIHKCVLKKTAFYTSPQSHVCRDVIWKTFVLDSSSFNNPTFTFFPPKTCFLIQAQFIAQSIGQAFQVKQINYFFIFLNLFDWQFHHRWRTWSSWRRMGSRTTASWRRWTTRRCSTRRRSSGTSLPCLQRRSCKKRWETFSI